MRLLGFGKLLIPVESKEPEPIPILEKGKVLYDRLFAPIAHHLTQKTKQLVIMPDRALYHLPFEALVRNGEATSYSDADYLIEDYAISYAPNSTMISFPEADPSSHESEFVLFTPTFSGAEEEVFQPTEKPDDIPDYIWSQVRDSVLDPILISERKWKEIANKWKEDRYDSQDATREKIYKDGSKGEIRFTS